MKILFCPASSVHVKMINELRIHAEKDKDKFSFFAYHLDEWYNLSVSDTLLKHNIDHNGYPNSLFKGKTIWQVANIGNVLGKEKSSFIIHFSKYVDLIRPDIFITFSDDGIFEMEMIKYCNREKIVTLFIQEAYIPFDLVKFSAIKEKVFSLSNIFKEIRRFFTPKVVTTTFGLNGSMYIAAINLKEKNWFAQNGISKKNIVVTGHLLMDILWRFKKNTGQKKENKKSVLIVSSGYSHFNMHDFQEWIVSCIKGAVLKLQGNFTFNLRLKPGENYSDWEKYWPDLDQYVTLMSSGESLYEQLFNAEFVIVSNSQTMMESLLLDKPTINLIPKGLQDPYGLYKKKAIYVANNHEELTSILLNTKLTLSERQKKARDKIYLKYFYKFDGKASERVCDFIRTING